MKRMKRGEVGMLRLLRDGVGDSSRWVLSARRLPLSFFTFLLLLGGSKYGSRVSLLQGKGALNLNS